MPKTVMQQRPILAPSQVGFHIQGLDANDNPIVQEYSKFGAPMGSAPAPAPASGKPTSYGGVDPLIAGQVGPMPHPGQYKGGLNDPQFQQDMQTWAKKTSDLKQAQLMAQNQARGAAFGANRPITALDPGSGQEIVTTLNRGVPGQTPGAPVLAGNQSGAFNLSQKRATFAEVDQNLANVKTNLPNLDNASYADRLAMAAALTPGKGSSIPGVGLLSHGVEAAGLTKLSPELRQTVFATRNMKQGVLSLRNALASGGVGSDYRIQILESEVPNEADFLTGSSAVINQKLGTFESVYNDILNSYPDIVSKATTNRNRPAPARPNAAPPTKPQIPGTSRVLVEGKDF
jgi:hypothetical protein